MSSISSPDNDLMTAQQVKALRHASKSQSERAKELEGRRRKSETEEALERARRKVREQADVGRRRRSR